VNRQALVIRYAGFAVLATLANLGTQRAIFALGGTAPWLFAVALFMGTGVGLVVKYVLDKNWIFYDAGQGLRDHGQKFTLYVVMGLVTTAIFWGMESLFWFLSHQAALRDAGAVIGLAIGYVVKYRLDRRFVFTDARMARGQGA
jgi:putative flippase GtrA